MSELFGESPERVACWEYVYERKFQRDDEQPVECPPAGPSPIEPQP